MMFIISLGPRRQWIAGTLLQSMPILKFAHLKGKLYEQVPRLVSKKEN